MRVLILMYEVRELDEVTSKFLGFHRNSKPIVKLVYICMLAREHFLTTHTPPS